MKINEILSLILNKNEWCWVIIIDENNNYYPPLGT